MKGKSAVQGAIKRLEANASLDPDEFKETKTTSFGTWENDSDWNNSGVWGQSD